MRVEFLELAGEVLVVGGAVFVFRESPHELADLLEHLGLDFSWYGVVLVDVPRKRGKRAGGLIGILLGEDRVPLDDVLHRLELVRQVKGHEVGAKVLVPFADEPIADHDEPPNAVGVDYVVELGGDIRLIALEKGPQKVFGPRDDDVDGLAVAVLEVDELAQARDVRHVVVFVIVVYHLLEAPTTSAGDGYYIG